MLASLELFQVNHRGHRGGGGAFSAGSLGAALDEPQKVARQPSFVSRNRHCNPAGIGDDYLIYIFFTGRGKSCCMGTTLAIVLLI